MYGDENERSFDTREPQPRISVQAAIVCGLVVWALCAIGMISQRHENRKLRAAYEAALGAFVTAKVPMANAAELQSLKLAIQDSKPSVTFVMNQVAYRNDGSTYTVAGKSPITDFGIYRRSDGTWFAGSPTEENKK